MRKFTLALLVLLLLVLLYFGTHAELGTIKSITLTVAAVLNVGAIVFALTRVPEYLPSDRKQEGDGK